MLPRRLLALLAFSSVFPVSAALAARVAVLAPQMKPKVSPELRDKFHEALTKGFAKAGEVVPIAEVRQLSPDLLECTGGSCVARAASRLGVDRVVIAEIEDAGKNYVVKVHVYDATGADLGMGPEERCEICTVLEARRAVERAGERTVPVALAARRPAVKVQPNPDEEEGPGDRPRVAVRTQPRAAANPPPVVVARPTEPAPVVPAPPVTVTPPVEEPAERRPSNIPYRGLAIGAFTVAAVALGATIGFGYYAGKDSQPSCDKPDPVHSCPSIYKGNTGGAAAFGVLTAVAAGTGALMLYLDWKHRSYRRTTVGVTPTVGGAAAFASFEF